MGKGDDIEFRDGEREVEKEELRQREKGKGKAVHP
jgi:hypothetical protein